MRHALTRIAKSGFCIAWLALPALAIAADDDLSTSPWSYGVGGGAGYFNFRDSLYGDLEPDPPGILGDDWLEFFVKPWAEYNKQVGDTAWFAKASWAYAKTDDDASEISGGGADSADFDDLYIGFRNGSIENGSIKVAVGRYTYEMAHGFLISDGYADGGSRGGYWSNPRQAWAFGAHVQYQNSGHMLEAFYLDRDERPESDADTNITGMNYEWLAPDERWNLAAAYFGLSTNDFRGHLDGARVYNLRAFTKPFAIPLNIEAEFVREENGDVLDANAWYVMGDYTWEDSRWQPSLQYRYSHADGDDPNTPVDENYDPLFPGFRDWGTWWQGEIAGEYFLSNSNLKSHMLRLHTRPTENIGTGFIFFDYKLDQPGSYQGGVSSSSLAQEINWYMDWSAFDHFSFSFVVARNQPGRAVEEAFGRTKAFQYAMIYVSFSAANN